MATEVVHVIDPDQGAGYDYASLNAWNAAQARDLVTADEIEIAKCRSTGGSADVNKVNIDGWTTDATRYIKGWTDPAESYRHDGKWNTSKYRLIVDNADYALGVAEDYTKLIGLQFRNTNTIGTETVAPTGNHIRIETCVFNTACYRFGYLGTAGITGYIFNCICYDAASRGWEIIEGTWYLYNCTVHNSGRNIRSRLNGSVICRNVLSDEGAASDFGDDTANITNYYCTSGDGTADDFGGSNNNVNQQPSYVDEDGDDFHLQSDDTACKDKGQDLSSDPDSLGITLFDDDIDGETRSGTWDIGADEYVPAAEKLPLGILKPRMAIPMLKYGEV